MASKTIELTLYLAGSGTNSRIALDNVRTVTSLPTDAEFHLNVIDVLEQPELALEKGVLITPTLHVTIAGEIISFIGNLNERRELYRTLGIVSEGQAGSVRQK